MYLARLSRKIRVPAFRWLTRCSQSRDSRKRAGTPCSKSIRLRGEWSEDIHFFPRAGPSTERLRRAARLLDSSGLAAQGFLDGGLERTALFIIPHDTTVFADDDGSRKGSDPERTQGVGRAVSIEPRDAIFVEMSANFLQLIRAFRGDTNETDAARSIFLVGLNQTGGRRSAGASPIGPALDDDHLAEQIAGGGRRAVEPALRLKRRQHLTGTEWTGARWLATESGQTDCQQD